MLGIISGKISSNKKYNKKYFLATPRQLMLWKFKKHKLSIVALIILGIFYFIALFCEFFAPYSPHSESEYILSVPQKINFYSKEDGLQRTFVYGFKYEMNKETFKREYVVDKTQKFPIYFFVKGDEYKLWNLFKMRVHFIGVKDGYMFLFGSDFAGRDLLSRIIVGSRISLTIGLVGIIITFFIGLTLGGISGYFGGIIDNIIQRTIEFFMSIPTIPLWMAIAAALPHDWPVVKTYFAIILIMSLVGWTGLARTVRGKFLSLREEDFVTAARALGASNFRIIRCHLIPSTFSYIIVQLTLSIPNMILGETALSFIGVGLNPPVISWGVLLQDAQKIRSIAHAPWVLTPAIFVIITVLMLNFLGDGLRDAADPFSEG